MLLIYPPVAKPSEPPAGLARLSGALSAYGVRHRAIDANIEGLSYLMKHAILRSPEGLDTWTRRSIANLSKNFSALREHATYRTPDRYKLAVNDLNRVLQFSSPASGAEAGLADFSQRGLSPLRSADLINAAENTERNPFFPYFRDRFAQLLEESQPSVVGFSLNYLSQALTTFSMIGHVRKILPGAAVVLGGGLVTSWMQGPFWKDPFQGLVDHLVAGPGEEALLSMAGGRQGRVLTASPDYASFRSNGYISPGFILPYSASRGCYWRKCTFCPENGEGNPYVPIPPGRVISDLDDLIAGTNPVLVHLLDNAVSTTLMKSLSESRLGAPWYGFSRINRELTDLDFCLSLRRSGCVMLKIGLESGDQGVLDAMRKGIDLATVSSALKTLKKAAIATYVYLLFGTPEETEACARKTLDFVVTHREEIGFLNLAVFNMPVGISASGEIGKSSFYDADLSLYTDFAHPSGWDRRSVRKFLQNEFRRHKAISSILKKDPPFFTSNHAPFFCNEMLQ